MKARTENTDSLRTFVDNLKRAVATTSCRVTRATLQDMLSEAESRLQSSLRQRNASNSTML